MFLLNCTSDNPADKGRLAAERMCDCYFNKTKAFNQLLEKLITEDASIILDLKRKSLNRSYDYDRYERNSELNLVNYIKSKLSPEFEEKNYVFDINGGRFKFALIYNESMCQKELNTKQKELLEIAHDLEKKTKYEYAYKTILMPFEFGIINKEKLVSAGQSRFIKEIERLSTIEKMFTELN